MPRARLMGDNGKTREWKSQSLPAYQRRTKAADALIAGAYLNSRHVVLGADGVGPDHHAKGRRLAKPRRKA